MYALLAVSTAVFVFFGLQVKYEEDISKLVPGAATENSGLAFGNLKVKDKIFIQLTSPGLGTDELASMTDEFIEGLVQRDSANSYISNVLYSLDPDLAVNVLDFALNHIPSFVPEAAYPLFDKAIADAPESMSRNYESMMYDETGSATTMVCTDPLELRYALLSSLTGSSDLGAVKESLGGSGFTIVDGHFFCADSTVALAFVSPHFKALDSGTATKLYGEITAQIKEFHLANPEVSVYVHGTPVRSVGNARRIKTDLLLTIGLSLIVILLFICLCFKSLNILWQQILPVVYGAFFALACIYWIKGEMSMMALGIGAIVLGVALSYCLHVIVHQHFVGDVEKMLKDEALPVCLGCLTTIGAFIGLLFTESDLLRDFGLFATFALIGNTFFALVFLPHFLKGKSSGADERAFSLISRINSYPYDRKPLIILGVALIVTVSAIFSPKVGFDTNLRNLGFEPKDLQEAERLYADKNLHGREQRYYAAAAPTLDEAIETNYAIASALDSMKTEGLVKQTSSSLLSILFTPTSLQESRIDDWASYWTTDKLNAAMSALSSAARAQGLDPSVFGAFKAMVQTPYEPASIYDEGIIPEELISNFVEESEGKYMIFNSVQADASDLGTIDRAIASKRGAVVVDPFYYTNDMVRIIHDDFNVTLLISSIFVFIVLLLSFRSVLIALIAFLPMALSWYVVQGIMAIFALEFNLINIVISTFIFGIGVDYSIFVMQGLLENARGGTAQLLDYHKAAIFFSAFVLLVVVLALLFARHPAISSIGLSTLIGMTSTIVITYTLQPFAFRLLYRKKAAR